MLYSVRKEGCPFIVKLEKLTSFTVRQHHRLRLWCDRFGVLHLPLARNHLRAFDDHLLFYIRVLPCIFRRDETPRRDPTVFALRVCL